MKRLILIAVFVLTTGTLAAQNYIIVNSEKVFKSIDAYNTALSTLDKLAEQYQDMVDAKFAEVETLYNNYMNQKASLTAATRQTRENDILAKEKAAQEYQETLFGNDGTLMKKRIEMIEPIQKQVFSAIEAYAKQVGADVVLDSANNPTLLYSNPSVDRTQQVIDVLIIYEKNNQTNPCGCIRDGRHIALRTEIRAHQHPGSYLGDAGNEGDADQHRSLQ